MMASQPTPPQTYTPQKEGFQNLKSLSNNPHFSGEYIKEGAGWRVMGKTNGWTF